MHAGEQRNRQYDWGELDPAEHSFGAPAETHSGNTIRCLLGPDRPAQVVMPARTFCRIMFSIQMLCRFGCSRCFVWQRRLRCHQ